MIRVDIGQLLPDFLLTDQVGAAMAAALEAGLRGFCACVQDGCDTVLDTEKMPAWRLDEMAWELGCMYDYGAEISMKREWIRNAVPLYASYGTAEAIYKYLGGYFESIQVEEWWQYGAEGYHFRVIVAGQWTKKSADWAREAIEKVKNVRSVLDYLAVGSEIRVLAAAETDYTRFTCPMAGEIMAGVYPGEDL